MKFLILVDILFELLSKRRVTASYLAEKHGVSQRTAYRYIEILAERLPVQIKRGRNGGVYVSDSYRLPTGFMTEEEYEAAIEALSAAYSQTAEERFLQAKRKLSAQEKEETHARSFSGELDELLVDGGDLHVLTNTVRALEECLRGLAVADIVYQEESGEISEDKIEPHLLLFKRNAWGVYAFSHKRRAFFLFRAGRIFSIVKTEETFRKRPFFREDIPFDEPPTRDVAVRLEISETALPRAQELFGVENLRLKNGRWLANIFLPDDEELPYKLIALGAGVKILFPDSLKQRVAEAAAEIARSYE